MYASLPMYDFPSLRGATDRYWRAIREDLGQGPDALARSNDPWHDWAREDLLLSQSCGLPYRARLHGQVQIVGTPDYGLPGCAPGEYNSVLIARADDPRDALAAFDGARFAVNSFMSQSGWAGPMEHTRDLGVSFGNFVKTGAHLASAKAVASGAADIAGLDALSWHFIQAESDLVARLRVIDATRGTPATPYITAKSQDASRIYSAIENAIASLSQADRDALSLKGLVSIPSEAYRAVPTPPPPPHEITADIRADAGS